MRACSRPANLEEFLRLFGAIYEDSPWVAERAWVELNDAELLDLDRMAEVMRDIVDVASREEKTNLIRAHPHLAARVAPSQNLSAFSAEEQAGAGLTDCTPEEVAEFEALNEEYDRRFGFPFVVAVKGQNKWSILEVFRSRIKNSSETEFDVAIQEIHKIAGFRLSELAQRSGGVR